MAERTWKNVHTLNLCMYSNNKDQNNIGDEGIHYLHAFPNVQNLSLYQCNIHAEGVKILS